MGKPLSDQIINHPTFHKTSNFQKSFDPISSWWLAGVSLPDSDQPELFVV